MTYHKKTKTTNQRTWKCSLQRQICACLSLMRWNCQSTTCSATAKDAPMGRGGPRQKCLLVYRVQVHVSHLGGRTTLDGTQPSTSNFKVRSLHSQMYYRWFLKHTKLYPILKLNDPSSFSLEGVLDSGPYSHFVQILKCKMINSSISLHAVTVSRPFFLLCN